jgi:hypothetical protein
MESDGYNIRIIGHSKKDDHIEYIISIEKDGSSFTFTERYSGLRNLSESMRKFANKATFPKFPPKKFFGGEDEKFLSKRQQELNTFFELISKDKEFSSLPPLIKFIKEKKEKNEKSVNAIKIKPKEEKADEKELKKSLIKNSEKDYNKIVKEYNAKFYNMNNERELENNNAKFIYFFKNYKINNSDIDIKLDTGDENNFGNINKEEKVLESIEDKIKQKIGKITELYKALNDIYCTDGIVVPI